jgi:N-acetylglucosamine kinase-like BadF-type ATPase
MTPLLLGVDGGASKTVALIAEPSGRVLGAGRSGSSDIHNEASTDIAVDHVVASVRQAASAASVSPADLDSCVFGLCGADWPEDVDLYTEALSERLSLTASPTVMNDAFNTLRAGTTGGVGVALVMGTGGAVSARGPGGTTWFSGERMEATGAMEFGRWAFDRIIRGEYGSEGHPQFQPAALEAFDVGTVDDMVHVITRTGGYGRRSLARLAPIVLEAGHAGDAEAGGLIRDHGELLAGYVRRAAQRVGLGADGTSVVLAGGVFKHHCTDLRDTIVASIPEFAVEPARLEPVYGAVLMAADDHGSQPNLERLTSTGPSAPFFETA